jgi:hypothetical protein
MHPLSRPQMHPQKVFLQFYSCSNGCMMFLSAFKQNKSRKSGTNPRFILYLYCRMYLFVVYTKIAILFGVTAAFGCCVVRYPFR